MWEVQELKSLWTETMDIVNSFTLLLTASLLFVVVVVVVCHAQKALH